MKYPNIAFSGKMGVGKTTAANLLNNQYKYTKISFAGDLRDVAKVFFDFQDMDFKHPDRKGSPFKSRLRDKIYSWTPRDFLIGLGGFARYYEPDYWLNAVLDHIKENPKPHYALDDLRFKNEADALKKAGFILIRVNRYEKENPYGPAQDIPSETDLDDYTGFDYTVADVENTSIERLRARLTHIIDGLKK